MLSLNFVNPSHDYRPNWTPLSPITIIDHTCIKCYEQFHNIYPQGPIKVSFDAVAREKSVGYNSAHVHVCFN